MQMTGCSSGAIDNTYGAGANIVEIEGANHFFDHEFEFDLMDTIAELLQNSKE